MSKNIISVVVIGSPIILGLLVRLGHQIFRKIKQRNQTRADNWMKGVANRLSLQTYIIELVTPWHKDNLLNGVTVDLSAAVDSSILVLHLGPGHHNLTDRLPDMKGQKVVIKSQENTQLQMWDKRLKSRNYLSYWLGFEPAIN